MMSRCTSFVPPPKVRISAARCARSIRPASTSPADPERTSARAPSTSISSRYASTANSVPNTFVADAAAGPTTPADAIRQFISLRNSALACTRARLSRTHSASITRRPSASFVAPAHSRTAASAACTGAAEVRATRSWLSWLVISGHPWFSEPTKAEAGTRTDE